MEPRAPPMLSKCSTTELYTDSLPSTPEHGIFKKLKDLKKYFFIEYVSVVLYSLPTQFCILLGEKNKKIQNKLKKGKIKSMINTKTNTHTYTNAHMNTHTSLFRE